MIVERALRAAAEASVTGHDGLVKVVVLPHAAPTPGAARTRRYRERRKHGAVLIELSVVGTALSDLVALGWLDPDSRGDRDAVRSAVIGLAARALALQLRPES
jgi:hypothetical protein